MYRITGSDYVFVSASDTISDIAANTHYTASELAKIVQDIVNDSQKGSNDDED